MAKHFSHNSYPYTPKGSYEYEVSGDWFVGKRILFGDATDSSRSFSARIVAKYPTGSRATVYYDPDKPS